MKLVVDGNSIAHWRYHARPGVELVSSVLDWLERRDEQKIVVCFDSPRNWRYEIQSDYKGHRAKRDADLSAQLSALPAALAAMGYRVWLETGYEADDLCAALASSDATVASIDKDLCQLVDDARNVRVLSPRSGELLDEAGVLRKFDGVPAYRLRDWLAVCGDAADNIKGAPGWGPKTTAIGIAQSIDLGYMIDAAEAGQLAGVSPRLQKNLAEWRDKILQNYEIVGFRLPTVRP